jgi:hypothetical protein
VAQGQEGCLIPSLDFPAVDANRVVVLLYGGGHVQGRHFGVCGADVDAMFRLVEARFWIWYGKTTMDEW